MSRDPGKTHPEQILGAVAALSRRGLTTFSRDDVRRELGIPQPRWTKSYSPVFQAMRDHPGGAPPIARRFAGIFHRVSRGVYELTTAGAERVREMTAESPGTRADLRQVVVYPGEDGQWVAECPSLPGCISQGGTKTRAIANIREAISAYVAALTADKLPVPPEHFEALIVAV